jgi:hypothetical protein
VVFGIGWRHDARVLDPKPQRLPIDRGHDFKVTSGNDSNAPAPPNLGAAAGNIQQHEMLVRWLCSQDRRNRKKSNKISKIPGFLPPFNVVGSTMARVGKGGTGLSAR